MHDTFMRRAIELARAGMTAGDGGPFGAVVVRDGQIVGEGANRVLAHNDPT
ncbi:MAG: nucleoside deaminase, partial [Thermodesulfobacteriota bacterium]